MEPSDLVHYGLIPEFVGRFPVVVSTTGLTLEQMVRVMTEPKNALIKQYSYLFSLHHVDFHVTDDALRAIATMALRKNTGARGLRAILERVLMQAMFDIPDDPDVTAVVVNEEAVHTKTCVRAWNCLFAGCRLREDHVASVSNDTSRVCRPCTHTHARTHTRGQRDAPAGARDAG